MIPDVLREYPKLARPHVLDKRSFVMQLVPTRLNDWQHLGKMKRWELIQRAIVPAFADVDECYLYTDPDFSGEEPNSPAADFLVRDGKRFKMAPDVNVFGDRYREFWIDWNWNRGSVVWFQPFNQQHLESAFAQCFDPIAMENSSAYLGPNVVRFARRRTSESKSERTCFAMPSGVERLFVFASTEAIGSLFDLALENCRFTDNFRVCYGTP